MALIAPLLTSSGAIGLCVFRDAHFDLPRGPLRGLVFQRLEERRIGRDLPQEPPAIPPQPSEKR